MKRSRKSTTSDSSLDEELINQDNMQRKPKGKPGRMQGDSGKEMQGQRKKLHCVTYLVKLPQ